MNARTSGSVKGISPSSARNSRVSSTPACPASSSLTEMTKSVFGFMVTSCSATPPKSPKGMRSICPIWYKAHTRVPSPTFEVMEKLPPVLSAE